MNGKKSLLKNPDTLHKLTFASLVILVIGIFTSVSISALHHILIFAPGLFFMGQYMKKEKIAQLPTSLYCLDVMVGIVILSVLFNLDHLHYGPLKHILKGKYFFLGLLTYFAARAYAQTQLTNKKITLLIHLFLWATTLASASGLIALYTGYNPIKMKAACHPTRTCGLYGMYMTYGYGMSLFCILLTGALLYREQLKRWIKPQWLIIGFIINFPAMILSYARGAWIGYFLALPFLLFRKNTKRFIQACLLILFGSITLFSTSEKVRSTFLKKTRIESNIRRISQYKAAWKAFSEKPFLGYGYKNFEPHSRKIKQKYNIERPHFSGHAHSNFMEHLAATGFLGFLTLILFHLFWGFEMYNRSDWVGDIGLAFVVSLTLSGLFQYTIGDGENLFLIMGAYALFQVPRSSEVSETD